MNLMLKLTRWGETHHPKWVDIIRIVLGLFLVFKGIDFLLHMGKLTDLMSGTMGFDLFAYSLAGHYVVFAHLIGGLALVIGMFVRAASLLQIPILLGAVIFVNLNPELLQPYAEMLISLLVLVLLIYFSIAGNGPLSLKFPEERKHGE